MTVYGDLKRPIGRGRYKVVALLNETGPSSGAWTIDTGLDNIVGISVSPRTIPDADDTVYKITYSISGGTVTVVVKSLATGGGGQSWADVTDKSGFAVDIIAIGY